MISANSRNGKRSTTIVLVAALLLLFLVLPLMDDKHSSVVTKTEPDAIKETLATEPFVPESVIVKVDDDARMDYFLFSASKYGFKKDGLFMLWTNMKPNPMNDNIKNDEYLNHHFMNLIQQLVKNNKNIYFTDIGANMGIFAFFTLKYCEKHSKNCYLNLYEAQPKLARVISQTLMLNNFDSNVTLNNCLVDFTGVHKLCHTPGNQGMTRIMENDEIDKYTHNGDFILCEQVYGCEYNDYGENLNAEDEKICRFTKIDIEGHDLVFLMKHRAEFMENDLVFFEYFGNSKKTGPDELKELFTVFGETFEIFVGSSLVTKNNVDTFRHFSGNNMMKRKHPRCAI